MTQSFIRVVGLIFGINVKNREFITVFAIKTIYGYGHVAYKMLLLRARMIILRSRLRFVKNAARYMKPRPGGYGQSLLFDPLGADF